MLNIYRSKELIIVFILHVDVHGIVAAIVLLMFVHHLFYLWHTRHAHNAFYLKIFGDFWSNIFRFAFFGKVVNEISTEQWKPIVIANVIKLGYPDSIRDVLLEAQNVIINNYTILDVSATAISCK